MKEIKSCIVLFPVFAFVFFYVCVGNWQLGRVGLDGKHCQVRFHLAISSSQTDEMGENTRQSIIDILAVYTK